MSKSIRNLIVADSFFELMLSAWMIENEKSNDINDLIITDRNSNAEEIYNNLLECDLFNKVYFIKAKGFLKGMIKDKELLDEVTENPDAYRRECINYIDKFFGDDENQYDTFITSELDIFSRCVYYYHKLKNNSIKSEFVGEGFFACGGLQRSMDLIINSDYSFKDVIEDYTKLWIYEDMKEYCKADKIAYFPSVNSDRERFCKLVNKIFGYMPHKKRYHKKILFFEGSFGADNGNAGEVEIIKKMISIVGKENILIKRHPRNLDNPFEKLGVKVIEESYIPWEVVVANGDCEQCIFVTINSGSVICPILFNMSADDCKNKGVLLYKIISFSSEFTNSQVGKVYYESLYKILEKSDLLIVESYESLYEYMKNIYI